MVDPIHLTVWGVAALVLCGIAALVLFVGYQAYLARIATERLPKPTPGRKDLLATLRAGNNTLADQARQARETLERARDAVRYGATGR